MKRVLIIFSLLLSISSFAQNNKEFGIKGGSNLSNITDVKGLTGYEAGIFYKKMFTEKLALDFGLNLRKQSLREKTYNVESDISIHFLSLPITARYYFNKELYFRLGLQTSVITKAKIDLSTELQNGLKRDIKNHFNFVSLNAVGGIGYTIDKTIDIQIEYNLGFLDKFIEPDVALYSNANQYLSINLGWILFKE